MLRLRLLGTHMLLHGPAASTAPRRALGGRAAIGICAARPQAKPLPQEGTVLWHRMNGETRRVCSPRSEARDNASKAVFSSTPAPGCCPAVTGDVRILVVHR
jgi:hypothetical protein